MDKNLCKSYHLSYQTSQSKLISMVNLKNIAVTVLFGGVLFLVVSPLTPALANEGMTAFNRKDYNEAYRIWRRNPDSLESKYGMGRLHFEGLGGPQNTSKGLSLIDEASRGGYSPASEYLAGHFEKRKDFKSAARYLERLAEKSPSSGIQRRLVTAYSHTESKPLTKSTKYCSAVKVLAELPGGGDNASDMQACALAGKPSTVTRAAAINKVGATIGQAPTVEALGAVAKEFLDPKSESFNPVLVEKSVWTVSPRLGNPAIRALLKDAGVSYENCQSLPIRSDEAKKISNSYCTLAAIAGDEPAVKMAALDYAYGREGRQVDLSRSAALIKLSPTLTGTKEGTLIRLYALINDKDWEEHLTEMFNASSRLLELSTPDLINQFVFQLGHSGSNAYQQRHAEKLLRLAALTAKAEIQNAVFEQVKSIPPETRQGDDPQFIKALCDVEIAARGAEKDCRLARKPGPDGRYVLRSAPSSLDAGRVQRSQVPASADQGTPYQSTTRSQPSVNEREIEQSVVQCDSGKLDACALAAKTIMGKFPPRDYRDTSEEERKKIALKKLERAADGGAVSSLAMLYDLYSADLDSRLREKARKYLAVLESKNVPEGRLRAQLEILNVDPISGVFGAILDRSKYKEACITIKLLLQRRELNQDDEVKAMAELDGAMCTAVK